MFPKDFRGGETFHNRISKIGVIDFQGLHKLIVKWINENKYDFTLEQNQSKAKPQGNESKLVYVGEKKLDDYCEIKVSVEILAIQVRKTKLDGKDLDSGNFEILTKGSIKLDYNERYKQTKFGKFLMYLYNNYFIRNKIFDYYMGKSYTEPMELHDKIKKFLDLYGK